MALERGLMMALVAWFRHRRQIEIRRWPKSFSVKVGPGDEMECMDVTLVRRRGGVGHVEISRFRWEVRTRGGWSAYIEPYLSWP